MRIEMKKIGTFIPALVCAACLSSSGDDGNTKGEKSPRRYLDSLNIPGEIPGLQYTAVNERGVIFEYARGYRELGKKIPVRANTAFMLNSSTKVFTAAAILQLSEKGKIDLDRALSLYYPDHPYGPGVTIRHLLNQTSGIPNPMPIHWLHFPTDRGKFVENNALRKVLGENPKLSFAPGEKYAYSNISYWLLGKVIERVSGLSYCEYLRRHVFAPLDIGPGELSCTMPGKERLALGYQKKYTLLSLFLHLFGASKYFRGTEEGYLRFRKVYHNGPAYGGLYGTGRGVALFLGDMLREKPRLFSSRTRDLFFSTQKNNKGEVLSMTPGFRRGRCGGIPYYGKPGGGPGFHGNIRIYPSRKIATVLLVNKTVLREKPINDFSDRLDRRLLDKRLPEEKKATPR